jgi:hypothetical protein
MMLEARVMERSSAPPQNQQQRPKVENAAAVQVLGAQRESCATSYGGGAGAAR